MTAPSPPTPGFLMADDTPPRRPYDGARRQRSVMAEPQPIAELDSLGPLLEATADGDRQAFARVYQLAGARLFAVALRMTRRRDLAEDALQDAFVTIWRKAAQYAPDRGAPMAWMTIIVRSRTIDMLRRRPHGAELHDNEATAPAVAETWRPETATDISGCLGQLPENQRKAILLAYYHGLTHGELAHELAVPLGTAKSWVRRGLLQLRECMDP